MLEGADWGIVFAMDHVYRSWAGPPLVWLRHLGSLTFLSCLTLLTSIWFAKIQGRRAALALVVLFGMGVGVCQLTKNVIKRSRPHESRVPESLRTTSYSFPSGHALNSAVVYLSIALLLRQMSVKQWKKRLAMIICPLLVILIGFSRMVLGVHFLSDVLAGWALGTALAFLGAEWVSSRARTASVAA